MLLNLHDPPPPPHPYSPPLSYTLTLLCFHRCVGFIHSFFAHLLLLVYCKCFFTLIIHPILSHFCFSSFPSYSLFICQLCWHNSFLSPLFSIPLHTHPYITLSSIPSFSPFLYPSSLPTLSSLPVLQPLLAVLMVDLG